MTTAEAQHRLALCEGLLLTLNAPEKNSHWTAMAIQNAQGMFEGKRPGNTPKWDGTAGHVNRLREALAKEQKTCEDKLGEDGLTAYRRRVAEAEKPPAAKADDAAEAAEGGEAGEEAPEGGEEELDASEDDPVTGGPRVAWLQERLAELGFRVLIDGDYGAETAKAVEDFQEANGLKMDSQVGEQTKRALRNPEAAGPTAEEAQRAGYGKVAGPPAPNAMGPFETSKTVKGGRGVKGRKGQKVSTAEEERLHPRAPKGRKGGGQFIEKGDKGKIVNRLQDALGVKKSGEFDDATKSAVERYQRSHGLEVDGVVGNQTAKALTGKGTDGKVGHLNDERLKALRTDPLTGGDGKSAKKTAEKPPAKKAKKPLASSTSSSSDGSSSGISSSDTSSTGTASSSGGSGSTSSSADGEGDGKGLSSGDSGDKVRELQRALGLPITGQFNRRTERAVKRYQQENGLPVTGRVKPSLFKDIKSKPRLHPKRPEVERAKAVTNQKGRKAKRGKGTVESKKIGPDGKPVARRAVAGGAVAESADETIRARARAGAEQRQADEALLSEALGRSGKTVEFDPDMHPRDRRGKFREVLKQLEAGDKVQLPSGVKVVKSKKGGFEVKKPKGGRIVDHDSAHEASQVALRQDTAYSKPKWERVQNSVNKLVNDMHEYGITTASGVRLEHWLKGGQEFQDDLEHLWHAPEEVHHMVAESPEHLPQFATLVSHVWTGTQGMIPGLTAATEEEPEPAPKLELKTKPFDKRASLERRLAEAVEARKDAQDSVRFAECRARELYLREQLEKLG